jgi:uncharacterized protein (DUF58 family)
LWLVAIAGGVALMRLYFDHPRLAKNSNPIVAIIYLGTGCVLVLWGVRALVSEVWAMISRRRHQAVRRYSVRMPREAFAYMLILAVLCLGALLGHSNMLMLVFGLTAGPFVLNGQMTLGILSRLRVTRRLPHWATVDENFSVTLNLINRKRFLSSWMVIAEDAVQGSGEAMQPAVLFTCVPPRSQRDAAYSIRPARRGVYEFGPVRIFSRFPLGLMERSFEMGQIEQLVVFPKIGRLKPRWWRVADVGETVAERLQLRAGSGDDDFHRLREYRSGDNPRDIHWRTTARRNQLMVREYQHDRRPNLLLVLELWIPQAPQPADLERVELAVSFAATVCVEQAQAGVDSDIDLVICGKSTSIGSRSAGSISGLLEELALAQPAPATELAGAIQSATKIAPARQRRVVVTTRPADATRPAAESPAATAPAVSTHGFEVVVADPQSLVEYFDLESARLERGTGHES